MVNFYSDYIHCNKSDSSKKGTIALNATLEQVAGESGQLFK